MIDSNSTKSTSLCPINGINLMAGCPVSHNDGQSSLHRTIATAMMLLAIMAFSISPCLAEEIGWSPGLFQNQSIEQSGIHSSLYIPELKLFNDQNMAGFETQTNNDAVPGLSIFDYSFNQQPENLDADYKPEPFTSAQWYFDLSGGRINGDGEAHEDEVPQNNQGTAEASLPIVGYQSKFFTAEFSEQGFAAAMITAEFTF